MSDKFMFENAKIKSREPRLISTQSLQRLLDCSNPDEAFRTLLDMGFGGGAQVETGDFDTLFRAEKERQIAFLKEFNVDGVLDVFLIEYDWLNLKALLKSLAGGNSQTFVEGLYAIEELKAFIDHKDDEKLPHNFSKAIDGVKKLVAQGEATAHNVDVTVDKAMFEDISVMAKKRGKLISEYFARRADIANLSSFLRCKKYGLDGKFYVDGEVAGGKLTFLSEIYEDGDDALREKLKGGDYYDVVCAALDSKDLVAFEVASDNMLLSMVKAEKDDMFSAAPIVAYHIGRATEFKVAKLIVAGIKNKVDPQKIRQRMRELYA